MAIEKTKDVEINQAKVRAYDLIVLIERAKAEINSLSKIINAKPKKPSEPDKTP